MTKESEPSTKKTKTCLGWDSPSQTLCTGREAVAVAVIGDRAYLYAGLTREPESGELGVVGDMYCFCPEAGWSREVITGATPLARTGHTMTAVCRHVPLC